MKYGCCIIETRPLPNLREIIQEKHLNFIPKDWGLTMFLSDANKHLVKPNMFNRETDVRILPTERIDGRYYNRLLMDSYFWSTIKYEKVLIFQHDSELLRPGIEDFVKYDFVGAPHFAEPGMMNGGLSLRDVKKCFQTCEKYLDAGQRNEDWHFSIFMPEIGAAMPTKEEAQSFSVETTFSLGSLGCHAIDKWLTPEQCEQIRNQYK